jgi:hypothetical protein
VPRGRPLIAVMKYNGQPFAVQLGRAEFTVN